MSPPRTVTEMLEQLRLRDPGAARDRPRVVLNMIASADGRGSLAGRSGGLSSPADRELLHALREGADGVLVGAGTVRAERYGRMLADADARARRVAQGRTAEPVACIVSGGLSLPPEQPLLNCAEARVVIVTAAAGELAPAAASVSYVRCPRQAADGSGDGAEGGDGSGATEHRAELDLAAGLRALRADYGLGTLVCEGGPTLAGSLLTQGLLDELLLTLAPVLVGGRDPLTIISSDAMAAPAWLELAHATPIGSHVFLHYRRRAPESGGQASAGPPGTGP